MQSIVSLLDKENEIYIQGIWKELENKFNLKSSFDDPIPHFSYLVTFETLKPELLNKILNEITAEIAPFKIRAHGVGVFIKPKKVIFIPVVRDKNLTNLHNILYENISESGIEITSIYSPQKWIPHITLSVSESFPENLGEIIYYLCHLDFDLKVTIDNLAVIYPNSDNEEASIFRFRNK